MILDTLAEATRQRVEKQKKEKDFFTLRREAEALPRDRAGCFRKALEKPGLNFITEVKKASPSKGSLPRISLMQPLPDSMKPGRRRHFRPDGNGLFPGQRPVSPGNPPGGGNAPAPEGLHHRCLHGGPGQDPGADAILLIAAILSDSQLEEYRLMAESLGMDALVEAHDEEEVERALRSGARVLGVNNRNLKDFTVDIGNSLRLRPRVPKNIPFVAESGIKSRQQTAALEQAGVNGVLIGETLMRSPDMKAALAELRGEIL